MPSRGLPGVRPPGSALFLAVFLPTLAALIYAASARLLLLTVPSTLVALAPVLVLVLLIPAIDRYGRMSALQLGLLVAWGAVIGVTASAFTNDLTIRAFEAGMSAERANLANVLAVAPVVEETIKGIGVVWATAYFVRARDRFFVPVLAAVVIGLGFAGIENAAFIGKFGIERGVLLERARGILIHPACTVIFGLMLGITHRTRSEIGLRSWLFAAVGALGAASVHSLANAVEDGRDAVHVLFTILLFAVLSGTVVARVSAIRRALVQEVAAGVVDEPERVAAAAFRRSERTERTDDVEALAFAIIEGDDALAVELRNRLTTKQPVRR